MLEPAALAQPTPPTSTSPHGGLVLERRPRSDGSSAQALPKGSKPVRVAQVSVRPLQDKCPPVKLDLTLTEEPDGTHRMIASSPDGHVASGLDVPLGQSPVMLSRQRQWASGISYEPVHRLAGAFVERDFQRLRVGVDVQQSASSGIELRARVGWRF